MAAARCDCGDYEEGGHMSKTTIQGLPPRRVGRLGSVTDDAGTTQYLPAVQPQRRQPPMLGEVLPAAPTEPAACSMPGSSRRRRT